MHFILMSTFGQILYWHTVVVLDVSYLAVAACADAAGAQSVHCAGFQVLTLTLCGRPAVCNVPLIGYRIQGVKELNIRREITFKELVSQSVIHVNHQLFPKFN